MSLRFWTCPSCSYSENFGDQATCSGCSRRRQRPQPPLPSGTFSHGAHSQPMPVSSQEDLDLALALKLSMETHNQRRNDVIDLTSRTSPHSDAHATRSSQPATAQAPRIRKADSALTQLVSNGNAAATGSQSKSRNADFNLLESEKRVRDIATMCTKLKQPFTDDSFIPGPRLLTNLPNNIQQRVVKWLRPSQLAWSHGTRPTLFPRDHPPRPSDIVQGCLGNCWLVSALAVLTQQPLLLEKIFKCRTLSVEKSKQIGLYHLTFYLKGARHGVIIDDILPCNQRKKFVFTQLKRGQLWAPLIEKALAKQLYGYSSLTGGHVIDGLRCLTGCACEDVYLQAPQNQSALPLDSNLLWARLDSYASLGFPMGASCSPEWTDQATAERYSQELGLQTSHCYSLLTTKTINDSRGRSVRLVQLRNPWGSKCWKGRWGNHDKRWTHTVLRQVDSFLPRQAESVGEFWMEFDDFRRYFYNVSVAKCSRNSCTVRHSWQSIRGCISSPVVGDDTAADMTVNGLRFELFRGTDIECEFFDCSGHAGNIFYILCRWSDASSGWDFVTQSSREKHHSHSIPRLEVTVDAGSYLLIPVGIGSAHNRANCNVVVYASQAVLVEEQPEIEIPVSTIKEILATMVRASNHTPSARKIVTFQDLSPNFKMYRFLTDAGYLMLFDNEVGRGGQRSFHAVVRVGVSGSNIAASRGLHTVDAVAPGQSQFLNFVCPIASQQGHQVAFQFNIQQSVQRQTIHSPYLSNTNDLHQPFTMKFKS